jgi:hypothetical protein
MATLNTAAGWTEGDQIRILVASGLSVGGYQKEQMTVCMNELGEMSPASVGAVQDLLDQFDEAQANMSGLNAAGDGKTLIKADVLEWEKSGPGMTYSPEREISRIRGLLYQYFGFCPLFNGGFDGYLALIRS